MSEPIVINTLCGRDSVDLLGRSVETWNDFIEEEFVVQVFSDGTLGEDDEQRLQQSYQALKVVRGIDSVINDTLFRYTNCKRYRNSHPIWRKLFDVPLFLAEQKAEVMIFIDTDIFFTKKVSLINLIEQKKFPLIGMKDSHNCVCPLPDTISRLFLRSFGKIRGLESFNSGIVVLKLEAYRLSQLEALLSDSLFQFGLTQGKWTWEQTTWAFWGHQIGAAYLDPADVVVADKNNMNWGKLDEVSIIHLVGNVRLLYLEEFYQFLSSQNKNDKSTSRQISFSAYELISVWKQIPQIILNKIFPKFSR